MKQDKSICNSSKAALIILLLIAIAFIVLTFIQPQIPLFEDPIDKTYECWQVRG